MAVFDPVAAEIQVFTAAPAVASRELEQRALRFPDALIVRRKMKYPRPKVL
jgi:hypothetical protein